MDLGLETLLSGKLKLLHCGTALQLCLQTTSVDARQSVPCTGCTPAYQHQDRPAGTGQVPCTGQSLMQATNQRT